jgi:hypothetical protein
MKTMQPPAPGSQVTLHKNPGDARLHYQHQFTIEEQQAT